MRHAWVLLVLLIAAGLAHAQINPKTQIAWPANCFTNPAAVYNALNNTCFVPSGGGGGGGGGPVDPYTQITWPTNCFSDPGAFYNANTNTCINPNTTVLPIASPAFTGTMTGPTINLSGYIASRNLPVSVLSFGAKCDGSTDDTAALNAAWTAIVNTGGEIDLPQGKCMAPNGLKWNTTSPNSTTLRIIRGLGMMQSYIVTTNANIGIELGGAVGVTLSDFTLQDTGTTAAVGIFRYRTDWTLGYPGQCGSNVWDNVEVDGNYSIANIYSVGCEVNNHRNVSGHNGGTGAVLAIAYNNCLGATGMTMPINAGGASNTVNHFDGGALLYYGSSSTGSAVDFCNGSADDVTFNGTYFDANSPAANIRLGHASTDNIQGSKSFHSVRFEGTGDAFALNGSSFSLLTVDSGTTFGETSPGIDMHQINTSWAGGAVGLTQADIHGVSTLGRGMTLGPIFASNIVTQGPMTILQNSLISGNMITAKSFSFPSNWTNIGTVLTQNDFNAGAGSAKIFYGPNSIWGSAGGSVAVMTPFYGPPSTPVNGELATADGYNWKPPGVQSQQLVQYRASDSSWQPVGLPPNNPIYTGVMTGPTSVWNSGFSGAGAYANLFTDSNYQTGQVTWVDFCQGSSSSFVVNTPATTDPQGGNNAMAYTPVNYTTGPCGSTPQGVFGQHVNMTAGQTYTLSGWFKGAAGGEAMTAGLQTYTSHAFATITNQWARYSWTFTAPATASINVYYSTVYPNTIYGYGAQIEPFSQAGVYNITTTTNHPLSNGFIQNGYVMPFSVDASGRFVINSNLFVNGYISTIGPAQISSMTSLNSDLLGELSFSSATTATYTFQDTTRNIHPECGLTPMFNAVGNMPWATYSGGPAGTAYVLTINFASAVTGSVSYLCGFRN